MKLSLQQKEQFFHELTQYVESGRSISQALELKAKMRPGAIQQVADRMLREGSGETAVSYFAAVPDVFSPMDREIVNAGEKGGLPERAFKFLREYYETMARARAGMLLRIAYPFLLLHIGAVLLAVPALVNGTFADFVMQIVVFVGVFYVIAFLTWLVVNAAVKASRTNTGIDGILQTLPVIGGTRVAFVGSRFCAAMGMFVQSGAGILGSMDRSADASGSARFRKGADAAIHEVKNGGSLGEAVVRTRAFPEAIDRAFQVGENSGKLDEEMNRLAVRYSEQFRTRTDATAKAVSGVIYAAVALAFGVRILSFWISYYSTLNSLLN